MDTVGGFNSFTLHVLQAKHSQKALCSTHCNVCKWVW